MKHRPLFYLADTLSLLRVVCAVAVVAFAFTGEWVVSYVLLVLGWATDLVDGLSARRFGSLKDERPNLDSDAIGDTVIAFASSLVPVVYVISRTGWTSTWSIALLITYITTMISAVWMSWTVLKPRERPNRMIVAVNMIVMHGILQICLVIMWFSYMAFGKGIVTIMTGVALLGASLVQLRKIRLWTRGRLA